MANPFLSMGDPIAPTQQESFNPFMMDDSEPVVTLGENPFAGSNPFSDFSSMEPAIADTVPHDIFGNIDSSSGNSHNIFESNTDLVNNEQSFHVKPTQLNLISDSEVENIFDIHNDESLKPKRPPPPTRPLPPETQNLILTVTGQMDFTSSEMLGRIPPTRTPSPISAMDLHSPGTTPEPPVDMFFDHEDKEPFEVSKPCDTMIQNTIVQATPTSVNLNQNNSKPARPPPRPQPPPIPPAPKIHEKRKNNDDDINLFAASSPLVIKPTKEAILSLYTKKEEEKKPVDFLSDDLQESSLISKESTTINDQCSISGISVNLKDHDIMMTHNEKENVVNQDLKNSQTSAEVQPPSLVSSRKTSVADESSNPFENADVYQKENLFNSSELMSHAEENIFSNDLSNQNGGMINENVISATVTPFSDVSSDAIYKETTKDSLFADRVPHSTPFETDSNNYEIESSEPARNVDVLADGTRNITSGASFATAETPFVSNDPPFSTTETPFSINDQPVAPTSYDNYSSNIFGTKSETFIDNHISTAITSDAFATVHDAFTQPPSQHLPSFGQNEDAFDAFSAKFDSTGSNNAMSGSAWGDQEMPMNKDIAVDGFGGEAFDEFLSMDAPPAPSVTPAHMSKQESQESDDDNFSFTIRPKAQEVMSAGVGRVPVLAPPPRPQALPESPRINPFAEEDVIPQAMEMGYRAEPDRKQSGSETPPTPLFDDDVSQPLEDFPRTTYAGPGWEMQLRQPNKKKITGQRFWKKIFVRLAYQGDNPVVQLYNTPNDKEPFQELPLQACYSVSEIGAQQYDQFGKIFTVKLQYIFYKERPGVRPGQVTKAERITNKLSQFAAYAIQGDYQGVKEFGSDLKKLGLPVEHAPQISQLFKIGSLNFEDVKQFSVCVEEALFKLPAHRDRALTYKMEEVQITAVDELYVEQDAEGSVLKQIARVRLFFLGFLSGMPDIELGVNDLRRQGKEVVGRHDIIPVVTEEWIRVENTEFHTCVQPEDFAATQIIKFKPPDACYIELMRFRIRPPKNRELPLQLKAVWCVNGNKVELRADVLVPGFASRKLGQIPCEDVMIRFPIPESWIYLFRVEKHFRYGSVKSAHRRTGKIKGIERFLGAVDTPQESLIEVTSGQAKYEHQHRAIVWRMPRLPKEGQGAYTTHNMVCRMALTSYDQIPAELAKWAYVEFTMPATQVSHMTVRSVSLVNHDSDDPPEKYVRYLARHEYTVGIEYTTGTSTAAYVAAVSVPAAASKPDPLPSVPEPQPPSSSDSD